MAGRLRHSFATNRLAYDYDTGTSQELLIHADVRTTTTTPTC
jgi:site-specific recombinase XerD